MDEYVEFRECVQEFVPLCGYDGVPTCFSGVLSGRLFYCHCCDWESERWHAQWAAVPTTKEALDDLLGNRVPIKDFLERSVGKHLLSLSYDGKLSFSAVDAFDPAGLPTSDVLWAGRVI
jgi:hypothetical protein